MAKRTVKKASPSVRQKTEAANKPRKTRPLTRVTQTAARPIRATGRGIKKAAKPFSFLLAPFKTKPVRFVGRTLSKVLFLSYFRESWKELRKVTWPNRKQTLQLSLAVFAFAFVFSVVVAITDYGLDKIFRKVLLQ